MLKSNSLGEALSKSWDSYEKQVQIALNFTSPENIHQLRILTQKLEAVLTLVNSLHSTYNPKNIMTVIKNVRQNIGPLRDMQVVLTAIENFKDKKLKSREQSELTRFFVSRKRKAKKKAIKCLQEISLNDERKKINKLTEKIRKIELVYDKKKIQSKLNSEMKASVLKFNKVMENVNPEKVRQIHQVRILAKNLRYRAECVNAMTGIAQYDLKNLKRVQSVAGRIQNDTILLKTLGRYFENKNNADDSKALEIKKKTEANQARLIKRDFENLSPIIWKN